MEEAKSGRAAESVGVGIPMEARSVERSEWSAFATDAASDFVSVFGGGAFLWACFLSDLGTGRAVEVVRRERGSSSSSVVGFVLDVLDREGKEG